MKDQIFSITMPVEHWIELHKEFHRIIYESNMDDKITMISDLFNEISDKIMDFSICEQGDKIQIIHCGISISKSAIHWVETNKEILQVLRNKIQYKRELTMTMGLSLDIADNAIRQIISNKRQYL